MILKRRMIWVGVIWLTAVLRTRALFVNNFHADEALFGSWARHIAVWRDPLLLTQAVDKPPLLFYLQALFYPFQGPVEWAARLPNYVASIVLVPLVGVVVWKLFRRLETAVFAAILVALSPMHIQFSASAFTDPLLTTFLFTSIGWQMLSLNWLEKDRGSGNGDRSLAPRPLVPSPRLCGFFFGLAVLTKHQAWLFLPLIVATGLLFRWQRDAWWSWLKGFVPLLFVGWVWEFARNGRLTLVSAQLDNVGGIQLVELSEMSGRLIEWGKLGQYVVNYWFIGVLIVGYLALIRKEKQNPSLRSLRLHGENKWFLLLASFIIGYSALHLLLDIPVWDRYFLPLVPLTAVLLAFIYQQVLTHPAWKPKYNILLVALSGVLFLPSAIGGMNGRFPIGARPFADSGASVVAEALADEPYGTVLYDHWYSWHWRYHLFDKKVHLNWFPDEDELLIDLDGFYDETAPRYLALPTDARRIPVETVLVNAGYSLEQMPIDGESDIILYLVRREKDEG